MSTYFDAPDAALRMAGLSLRVRRTGERRVQTINAEGATAAGLFARAEWEREIAGDCPVVDEASGPISALLPISTRTRSRQSSR